MLITANAIAQLAPRIDPARAYVLASELNISLTLYGAAGLLCRAHFIAQACHETRGFARFDENLNYLHATAIAASWPGLAGRAADLVGKPQALANAAYGGRLGNGDEASGDGWRYRGRGIFQLTGKLNYIAASKAMKADLVGQPDLLLAPRYAVESALWYWRDRGCIEAATRDDCDAVTRIINGPGMEGLSERRLLTDQAKQILTKTQGEQAIA